MQPTFKEHAMKNVVGVWLDHGVYTTETQLSDEAIHNIKQSMLGLEEKLFYVILENDFIIFDGYYEGTPRYTYKIQKTGANIEFNDDVIQEIQVARIKECESILKNKLQVAFTLSHDSIEDEKVYKKLMKYKARLEKQCKQNVDKISQASTLDKLRTLKITWPEF